MNENIDENSINESSRLIDRMIDDARAEGYAQGREDQRRAGAVRLAMMSDELRLMPEVLVDAYGSLCAEAMNDGTEGRGVEDPRLQPKVRGWRTSSNQVETRGLAKASGKKGSAGGPEVKSERLLALKSRVDRQLRKIARQIELGMKGELTAPMRKCSRCGKYGEDTWNWCPRDGGSMQSEDR